jgi:CubicO group peptidase (beta-lactamase class C family)
MLKSLFSIILLVAIIVSCNISSAEKIKEEDSLQYYPPTPKELTKEEFRHYYRTLSNFFDSTLLRNGFNGGILVAVDGAVVFERYKGKTDLRKNDTLTQHTSFHIASTSKTFTGTAVLRLVQEGRLSLEDSLQKFFPGLPYPGITIHMLLSHRSGLPNYLHFMSNNKWGMVDGKWNGQMASNQDVVNMMYEKKPDRAFPPGKRFNYCNTNYVLLAMIIEKITGLPYPDYMRQKFFEPLQMKDTYVFTLKDTLTAVPSFTTSGNFWDYDFLDATYGDKNIYSTPRDLLKWDQALYTDQLLRPGLLDTAFTPYSLERPSVHNYGLGWRLQILPNGKKIIYHFGKWHGFNAAFARLPDEKATIIILGNKFTRSVYNAAHMCYDIFGQYNQKHVPDSDEVDSTRSSDLSVSGKELMKKVSRNP